MGFLGTVRSLLAAVAETKPRDVRTEQSTGAYWCDDCSERIPEAAVADPGPPNCPSCGGEMYFERSPGTANCAC
jgi:Zn finger protein HypA/HybF involved in hydrogenase expression